MQVTPTPTRALLSPCIGVCRLDADGLCAGCHRSGAEIEHWTAMTDDQRQWLMDVVLPARAATRAA